MSHSDPRIPVRFGALADLRSGDAVLIEGEGGVEPEGAVAARFRAEAAARHLPGCACCGLFAAGQAGAALHALYLKRARSHDAAFRSVLALARTEAGRAAVREAVQGLAPLRAWFKLE